MSTFQIAKRSPHGAASAPIDRIIDCLRSSLEVTNTPSKTGIMSSGDIMFRYRVHLFPGGRGSPGGVKRREQRGRREKEGGQCNLARGKATIESNNMSEFAAGHTKNANCMIGHASEPPPLFFLHAHKITIIYLVPGGVDWRQNTSDEITRHTLRSNSHVAQVVYRAQERRCIPFFHQRTPIPQQAAMRASWQQGWGRVNRLVYGLYLLTVCRHK